MIVLAYLVSLLILPLNGFWINDNGCKFIQMEGILQTQYTEFSIPWPGAELDPLYRYKPLPTPFGLVVNGRLYGLFQPFFPLISSFPYRFLGFAGLYVLPLLSGLLTLPAVWVLAGFLPHRRTAQPLALWLVALCTPMWFYSMTFWEHTPAVCLAIWSVVFFIWYLAEGRVRHLALSALICGLSIYFREALYMWVMVLAVVSVYARPRRWHNSVLFLVIFAFSVAPLWFFQWVALGHPFGLHVTSISPLGAGVGAYLSERWVVIRNLLINSHGSLWLSVVISAPFLLLFLVYPRVSERAFNKVVLLLAAIGVASGLIVISGHILGEEPIWYLLASNGLFAASPILILAFIRGVEATGQSREGVNVQKILWLISLLYALAYLILSPALHTIGIYWGCRYLLPLYPLMGVLASSTIARSFESGGGRKLVIRFFLFLLIVMSFTFQIYSLYLLYERKSFSARINRVIAKRSEQVVIAFDWFLPQELAPNFYDRKIFLVRDTSDIKDLFRRLQRSGVQEVLMVVWRRGDVVLPGEKEVLDDGLNFTSLDLKSISLQKN